MGEISETNAGREPHLPRVSIGLPVYNGMPFLPRAIESILTQSFTDLELIICDNASTDRTQEVCEEYARRDRRVRYYRNERNLGAGPNYDLCFHRSRGHYFKWAAHDDMLAPGYLEKAVAALDARPEAVLCTVGITEIGPDDEVLRAYTNRFDGAGSSSPAHRFGCLINTRHQCEDFFGLYRREALVGSGLHDNYSGSDRVLLAEMALRGPFVAVADPLFLHREHNMRYTRAVLLKDRKEALLWQDTTASSARKASTLFHLVIYRHFWRLVRKNMRPGPRRWACYWQLVAWWVSDGHTADVARDVLRNYNPTLLSWMRSAKHAFVGSNRHLPPGSLPTLD